MSQFGAIYSRAIKLRADSPADKLALHLDVCDGVVPVPFPAGRSPLSKESSVVGLNIRKPSLCALQVGISVFSGDMRPDNL